MIAKRRKLVTKASRLLGRTIRAVHRAAKRERVHGKQPVAAVLDQATVSLRQAADLLAVAGVAQ